VLSIVWLVICTYNKTMYVLLGYALGIENPDPEPLYISKELSDVINNRMERVSTVFNAVVVCGISSELKITVNDKTWQNKIEGVQDITINIGTISYAYAIRVCENKL
jgi:hypothetical protein